ncbi:hypothetical protein F4819DRAFT_415641 [Hypoxylon fuscum]|nr:hypothetical protein F4819DRAFT_415641 [Hypoxylon fuscum]
MATRLPSALPRRPTTSTIHPRRSLNSTAHTIPPPQTRPFSQTPHRRADMIRRPKRPYTFTQIIQQTDGSTYTQRTTSPLALYKSTKDTRNHVLWNPSNRSLRNVEVDEAGKLAAFRGRFGRGWDAEKAPGAGQLEVLEAAEEGVEAEGEKTVGEKGKGAEETRRQARDGAYGVDALNDLISSYSPQQEPAKEPAAKRAPKKK